MKAVKRVCGCLVVLLLLIVSLGKLTDLMERKYSDWKFHDFFKNSEEYEVLFFGTSHVNHGILPMELWEDYGIASYNCGGNGNYIPTTYWLMKNVLDYASPKLVVIDGYLLNLNTKSGKLFDVHGSMDAFPLSRTKLSAVRDLLDDEEMDKLISQGAYEGETERRSLRLLWNFSAYHSRWNELQKSDFDEDYSRERGATQLYGVYVPEQVKEIPKNKRLQGDTAGTQYLSRMIQECKKRNIQVLLTYLPFPAVEDHQMDANRLYDIAEQYEVPYINFSDRQVVKYETDLYDGNHLNASGARKVTDYIGKYIAEHYDFSDHKKDEAYKRWQDDYTVYTETKASNLKQQRAFDVYLMCLADKNYNVLLEVRDPLIWNNAYYQALFENMGVDASQITERTDAVFVKKMGQQTEYFENFQDWKNFGISDAMEESADIRVTVFDRKSMNIVDLASFVFRDREKVQGEYAAADVYRLEE